jgi:deoxyinosine 3'endonuclease (endonuclease V)
VPIHSLVPEGFHLFGGVDVSFPSHELSGDVSQQGASVAVYVVWDRRTESIVYQDHEYFHLQVPYIPSFLAFREIDPLERLVNKQRKMQPTLTPSAVLVDGNGILHPRRAGIATCLGVRTGLRTIGVGKSLYNEGGLTKDILFRGLDDALEESSRALRALPSSVGYARVVFDSKAIQGSLADSVGCPYSAHGRRKEEMQNQVDRASCLSGLDTVCQGVAVPLACHVPNAVGRLSSSPSFIDPDPSLHHQILACAVVGHGGRIGLTERTETQKGKRAAGSLNPIFVSVGHRMSLTAAVAICVDLSQARIPEPVRQADLIGRGLLRQRQRQRGRPHNQQLMC